MKIHIITYAFSRSESLLQTFEAANSDNVTWHLFLHSQRPDVVRVCEQLDEHQNVLYYSYGTDRGLARSCNEGIIRAQAFGADVVIQLCDDITAGEGDVQRLADAVQANPTCSHVCGRTYVERVGRWEAGGFDVCAINLKAVEAVGYFDVNFWPVNFEDVDWKRRSLLSGFEPVYLDSTSFVHHDYSSGHGSGEFMEKFFRTRDYYIAKHGGDQGDERYSAPFNNATLNWMICKDNIENPYPEYRRKDIP